MACRGTAATVRFSSAESPVPSQAYRKYAAGAVGGFPHLPGSARDRFADQHGRVPAQLLPAREQMAFTLGFHIILVPFGVALMSIMLIANYRAIRRGDDDARLLAQRWSKVGAVLFAVGAVSGTVLSFELGLL